MHRNQISDWVTIMLRQVIQHIFHEKDPEIWKQTREVQKAKKVEKNDWAYMEGLFKSNQYIK
jgi:hypothetical protein